MANSGLTEGWWYYRLLGEEFGPVARSVLDGLIADGQIGESDEVRSGSAGVWVTVRQLTSSGSSISNGHPAGSHHSAQEPPSSILGMSAQDEWFYESLGEEWGPIPFEELLEHARQGDITPDDQVRLGRNGKWRRAGSVGRLMAVMPFSVREAKTIPTGSKTPANEFDSRVPLRESAPSRTEVIPPPRSYAAPPPPPPPPPSPIMPAPPVMAMPSYVPPPVAPGWGYNQPAPAPAPMNDQGWYAWLDGVECGPMDYLQISNWGKSGRVSPNDYVKQGKYSQWSLAKTIPGLVPAIAAPPPAPAAVAAPTPVPKPAAPPAPKPAPAAPPAAVVPKAPPAARPAPAARPDAPADAPPEKKWTDEWGSSSVKSTYNPALAAAASPAMPAKKAAAPVKRSKGGGGGLDAGALLKDKRVLGGVGAIAAVALIAVGIQFIPEGTGKFKTAYEELVKIQKEVEDKVASSPDPKAWKTFGDDIAKKTKKVTASIQKSKHPVKNQINTAASAINTVAKKKTPQDAGAKLSDPEKKLETVKKSLKL